MHARREAPPSAASLALQAIARKREEQEARRKASTAVHSKAQEDKENDDSLLNDFESPVAPSSTKHSMSGSIEQLSKRLSGMAVAPPPISRPLAPLHGSATASLPQDPSGPPAMRGGALHAASMLPLPSSSSDEGEEDSDVIIDDDSDDRSSAGDAHDSGQLLRRIQVGGGAILTGCSDSEIHIMADCKC